MVWENGVKKMINQNYTVRKTLLTKASKVGAACMAVKVIASNF